MIKANTVKSVKEFKAWCVENDYDAYSIGNEWFARGWNGTVPYRFNTDLKCIEPTVLKQY